MSGQPVIHPTDASKFREQYLSSLQQQIRNDEKNLQANKVYKKTGQTPAIVLDTRTSTEKLADTQRLKVEVRSGLKDIMDGATAEKVVQELDTDALEFLAQRIGEVITILKPKYRYGVPFVAFMTFMRDYYVATIENGDYLAGSQQKIGKEVLLGVRQILGNMINRRDLVVIADALDQLTGANQQIANSIRRDLDDLRRIIPTRDDLIQELEIGNELLVREISKQMNDALQELPTTQQIIVLLRELSSATKARDQKYQEEVLFKLKEVLAVKPELMEQMMRLRQEIATSGTETGRTLAELKAFVAEELAQSNELNRGRSEATIARITDAISRQLKEELDRNKTMSQAEIQDFISQKLDEQTSTLQEGTKSRQAEEAELRRLAPTLNDEEKSMLLRIRRSSGSFGGDKEVKQQYIERTLNQPFILKQGEGKGQFLKATTGLTRKTVQVSELSQVDLDKVIDAIAKRIDILSSAYLTEPPTRASKGAEASGNGLRRIRGRGITQETDFTKGIAPEPHRFVPFGRFHINTKKLDEDVITVKRPTGCNVDGFPVRRVSKDLGNVMRTIVGGGQPEFRHLEKLSDEEKVYLNQLVKKSKVGDRLTLLTPNKDDDEKDIHLFEVMKGELLSGQDNVDMVKKFKILIMKMMKKDLLPRNQAKDLLLDLATLGY